MTFDRAWVLPFTLIPLLWMFWEWRRTRRHAGLLLKALAFAIIVLAIAEPRVATVETKMAVAVLADTSASVGQAGLDRASQLIGGMEQARGRNLLRVLPFAGAPRMPLPSERRNGWKLEYTAGDSGRSTDLEAAVRAAIAELPPEHIPRLVLISDGKENAGSITRAAWQARDLGIPIDVFPLKGRPEPALRLESVSLPTVAFTGERFPVDVSVIAPRQTAARLEIGADGKVLGSNPIALEAGANDVQVHASIVTAGAVNLTGVIRTDDQKEVRFDRAITLRRPRVLYVSQDPPGTGSHLLQTLTAAQFDIDQATSLGNGDLTGYQIVVLNNWDLDAVPPERKDAVEQFVKGGGGLLVIGGERNVYAQNKRAVQDALQRALPAAVAPPRSPEGTCVVLIIDKSSSMEGKKIDLAKLSAAGVVQNLRPIDSVGVLIFDNTSAWAVPIRRADDRAAVKRLIAGITPDGGTQIAPALEEAYNKILPVKAVFKHILLLTDGISEEGDSMNLAKKAEMQHVTISTVGLGQDVNRAYLEKIAQVAGGKSYFLNEPAGLEQIVLKDVQEHTGSTAVEKVMHPSVAKQMDILEGVGMANAPALKGYVRFTAKPSADTILTIDGDEPLLTRWQYGLGRSAVFTSDAKSRWAADWVTWPGYNKFWTNVFRDLLPHSQAGEAKAEFDSASGDLIVDYKLGGGLGEPAKLPAIYAIGPAGFERLVPVVKTAAGSYRGRIGIGGRQGLFRIRPVEDSRAFPEVGFYRQQQELTDYGSNDFLLREIANYTGGRFDPDTKNVFDRGGRSIPSSLSLWPALLGLAILLNLAELFLRKAKSAHA